MQKKYTLGTIPLFSLTDFKLNASENLKLELYIKKTLGYEKGFGFYL